ncbi:tetratricopeptide repeat protein [Rhodocyclus tenuis]|uniref:Putative Zn-dependent protease n=1 Tax=Rhodocyclus tenuis TaxID=1066 RepID=A0A840G3H7_RHOTE|nr:tetratricopeptide repeat protein [Rhodocyclus tenuis]MBB4245861.1 putative Zn-dependent protease [Rhodocyclus tenuis]
MDEQRIRQLEQLLGGARDGALLRYSLGAALLAAGDAVAAVRRLREAIERDETHSASWKLLGRALAETGQSEAALNAFRRGVDAAAARGDVQAVKEMRVFARRLEKTLAAAASAAQ